MPQQIEKTIAKRHRPQPNSAYFNLYLLSKMQINFNYRAGFFGVVNC